MNGCSIIDYDQLVVATKEQILGSDLRDSTVHGTGFCPELENSHTSEAMYLQGPPLLVQVIEFTEVVRPHKSRSFSLKLSDGNKIADAFSTGLASGCNLNFNDMHLGFKVWLT